MKKFLMMSAVLGSLSVFGASEPVQKITIGLGNHSEKRACEFKETLTFGQSVQPRSVFLDCKDLIVRVDRGSYSKDDPFYHAFKAMRIDVAVYEKKGTGALETSLGKQISYAMLIVDAENKLSLATIAIPQNPSNNPTVNYGGTIEARGLLDR